MTTFILSLDGAPQYDKKGNEYPRRVILDEVAHGSEIATISADAVMSHGRIVKSAWCVARDKVDESKFYHVENDGWFATNTKNAALREVAIDLDQE